MNVIASAVLLTVGDPAASGRFFTRHLGFREVLMTEDVIHLSRDDAATDLVILQAEPEARPGTGLPAPRAEVAVSFSVTDLPGEYERLRREGARIVMPLRQEPWGEWVLELEDPNGVPVQLVEWVAPSGA
ncbi:VOC family protein [Streptomyces sp. NBC_00503]|uniref:VOC family protein n=1 Tax=Streptomyces sp. NBC_00503 TaxID=2903659 RepID=UPI002E812AD7|nr:VOC family protein [Streptomyces sp. NBC_00503]WUD84833.1 VOC family protein [Streptomyces sp. NBC_00503]